LSGSLSSPRVIWRLCDGKPGHENQTLGLADALQQRLPLQRYDIPVTRSSVSIAALLTARFSPGRELPPPALILGAGHATHRALLAARRAYGGRALVLMRPSLPLGLFDLCLIPEHDRPQPRANVLVTRGVLNNLRADGVHDPEQSLILIGGPSKHHGWDDADLIDQLQRLFSAMPEHQFILTNSRRTPPGLLLRLQEMAPDHCRIVPADETPPGWVAQQLARCANAWVTEDSVSMVYEALTAGCSVGLLRVPALGGGRVAAGVEQLLADGWVTSFERWWERGRLAPPRTDFNEAQRCADWLYRHWFDGGERG